MRWSGHVARRVTVEVHKGIWWGALMERDHSEYLGVDGRILLQWTFKKWNGGVTDWISMAYEGDRCRTLVHECCACCELCL